MPRPHLSCLSLGVLLLLWFQVISAVSFAVSHEHPLSIGQLLDELEVYVPDVRLDKRVPLSTDDNTSVPLVDLQVHQPPVVPQQGASCSVQLLQSDFGNSFNTPVVVPYSPPTDTSCGSVGRWAAIKGNLTVYSNGTQYDRLSSVYLSHVEIWRHSSAEPTKTGTIWTTFKDLTHYTTIFSRNGSLLMDFGNIISDDLGLDGVLHVTLTVTFYAPTQDFPVPKTADAIIPLSNLSPNQANLFTIDDSYSGGVSTVVFPDRTREAYVEIYASGNSNEEFWYMNTLDEFLQTFPPDAGLIGKGPFREVQVLVDGMLAGVVWPFPVIYTGGITPTNWRPLTSYGTYNQPTYHVDLTAFLPHLTDSKPHNITLTVFGQGSSPRNSINSNWFVSGNVQLSLASRALAKGRMMTYNVEPFATTITTGSVTAGNATLKTSVKGSRKLSIESLVDVNGSGKLEKVSFVQDFAYQNVARYAGQGWVQWMDQSTTGVTKSTHGSTLALRDEFSYPLSVFSNYTLYSLPFGAAYGSAINITFTRSLQPPPVFAGGIPSSIHSSEKAHGDVGLDDASGLRHAVNGSGETTQEFAYSDGRTQTYFRKAHAKNDAWVSDTVWGSLASGNPAVTQLTPGGGSGFRRELGVTRFRLPRRDPDAILRGV